MLKISNLSSGYNGTEVLRGISLDIDEPAIYVVLGPNGAGKTTMFRTVAGVLDPMSGTVELGGKNPIVVFPDVDRDEAASAIVRGTGIVTRSPFASDCAVSSPVSGSTP